MRLIVGERVTYKATGEVGVVRSIAGANARVAFGAQTRYVAPDDLEPLIEEPEDQLAAGRLGDSEAALLRLLSRLVKHAYAFDPASALSNARIEPQLHQAFVAHRVARKVAPRMILADEVGLGKTIEAGLIVKELRARDAAERVLIVTPASLVHQWQSEMGSKFNEPFEIIDGAAATHFGRGGKNPFTVVKSAICSLPFAAQSKRAEQIVEAGWDLVIFDEAHRVRRTRSATNQSRATQAYRLAEDLHDVVIGLLLLSATPVQLHAYELFSLIELVEPGLFVSYEAFERDRRRIPLLSHFARTLQKWPVLSAPEREAAISADTKLWQDLGLSWDSDLSDPLLRGEVLEKLTRLHPMADAMIRNRKAEVGLQGQRIARTIPVEMSSAETEIFKDVSDYLRDTYASAIGQKNNALGFLMVTYHKMLTSSSHALRSSFRRRVARLKELQEAGEKKGPSVSLEDPEELSISAAQLESRTAQPDAIDYEISVVQSLAARLDDIRDSKAASLLDLLEHVAPKAGAKIVIFTQFIETQLFLTQALELNGYSVVAFNGRMSSEEKEQAILRFRRNVDVLVSTEAGGEGRNLQFSHILINYDLPWNPMKVEQRIGRLDRIGQTHPVEIYNLVCQDTLEERIVEVLEQRIRIFEESVGSLDPILGEVEKDIERLVLVGDAEGRGRRFEEFSADVGQRVKEARLLEETMADFVMDRASFRKDMANDLMLIDSLAAPEQLETVVERGLKYLGGTLVDHADGGRVVTLSPRLAARLSVRENTWRGVFSAKEAVERDDLDFLACGHALIDSILGELIALPDAAVGARRSPTTPEGIWIELIYEVTTEAPLGQGRLIRHLVGADLVVRSSLLDSLPLGDKPIGGELPAWVVEAAQASEQLFINEFAQVRSEYLDDFEAARADRLGRLDRQFASQRLRLENSIAQARDWLDARSLNASPRDLKVLPARRGRLAKDLERLERLDEERALRRDAESRRQADIRGDVLGASLVIGTGSPW